MLPSSCEKYTSQWKRTSDFYKPAGKRKPRERASMFLTINKTALSNCSAILSAIFRAHCVGLLNTKHKNIQRKLEKPDSWSHSCPMCIYEDLLYSPQSWQTSLLQRIKSLAEPTGSFKKQFKDLKMASKSLSNSVGHSISADQNNRIIPSLTISDFPEEKTTNHTFSQGNFPLLGVSVS